MIAGCGVAVGRVIRARPIAGGSICTTRCVLRERTEASGCVLASGDVLQERINPGCDVLSARCVGVERMIANCGVVVRHVGEERLIADGSVAVSSQEVMECVKAIRGVLASRPLESDVLVECPVTGCSVLFARLRMCWRRHPQAQSKEYGCRQQFRFHSDTPIVGSNGVLGHAALITRY